MSLHAAIDLGASSGRVMLGEVSGGSGRSGSGTRVDLTEMARFRNGGVEVPTARGVALHWDVLGLWQDALAGLAAAGRRAAGLGTDLASVGIDTWAIDYGLLDADGCLLANPRTYRDTRTDGVAAGVHARLPAEQLYRRNGLQHLPFTTIYQLITEDAEQLARARTLLLTPDLLGYWLTGHVGAESTNASTTGLADVRTGRWADDLVALAGISPSVLPPVHDAGTVLGALRASVAERTGLGSTGLGNTVLTAVGTHDTASAVVGVPASDERFAYIACGTWGLVGVELESPVLTAASFAANFTNERGVDGRVRYLRNVMGLWVLQGCLAQWRDQGAGQEIELTAVLAAAAQLPAGGPVIDIDEPVFLPPGPMVERVQRACEASGAGVPTAPAQVVRCVLDSLAAAFARAVTDAAALSGRDVDVVHLVGGGALNTLLCQLTADACERPVLAGPVEATALGNVLVQARAHGTLTGSLEDLRAVVRASHHLVRYEPSGRDG